jgi:hypothetical protein
VSDYAKDLRDLAVELFAAASSVPAVMVAA